MTLIKEEEEEEEEEKISLKVNSIPRKAPRPAARLSMTILNYRGSATRAAERKATAAAAVVWLAKE